MISEINKPYLFLSSLDCGFKKAQDIFNIVGGSQNFLKTMETNPSVFKKVMGDSLYKKAVEKFDVFSFETLDKYFNNHQITAISYEHSLYPSRLKNLDSPPIILYAKGNLDLLKTRAVAIVGTRTPSFYGRTVTEMFTKSLAKMGLTIISGLALGVDTIAHDTTIENSGNTIAVMGSGFEHIYPAMNNNLFKRIAENGLVITEYYPNFTAKTYSFPIRNRIIAALSEGVLITEAGQKSGALHTKDYALDLGRNVYCVPGNISNQKSYSTNALIKHGHAQCVTCPEDILNDLKIESKINKNVKKQIQVSLNDQEIIGFLQDGERSFDYLQDKTNLSTAKLNSYLTTLQIRGIIKKLPGNLYTLALEDK